MQILLLSPPSLDRADVVAALAAGANAVEVVDTAAQATARLARPGFDVVALDLAAGDALRFLRKHAARRARVPVICVADRRQPENSAEGLRLGVADIVARPVRVDDCQAALANASEMVRIAQRPQPAAEVVEPDEGVFGASAAMRDVLGLVRRVAQSRCAVLIVGERGTGREMIARAIHRQGTRREAPFVKLACADASPRDFDRTLKASARDGATVYLEDLCELPPDVQARVEARLQAEDHPLRFVAAAQPRINDLVERGTIRRGLVDALEVVRIDVPPLRQRAEDIPLLATHFLKEACRRNEVPPKSFSRAALSLLSALPWVGNAIELRSLAERLAVVLPRGVVLLEDVLAHVRLDGAETIGRANLTLKDARGRFERDYITVVLQHHRGRMADAARELGIERTNLYRKIKHLNITWRPPD